MANRDLSSSESSAAIRELVRPAEPSPPSADANPIYKDLSERGVLADFEAHEPKQGS